MILLPAWRVLKAEAGKPVKVLQRDVTTRWNSTHDMAYSALENKAEYNKITDSRDHGLQAYALSDDEWVIVEELVEVLKVSCLILFLFYSYFSNADALYYLSAIQDRHPPLQSRERPDDRGRHTRDGRH